MSIKLSSFKKTNIDPLIRELLESFQDIVVVLDFQGRIVYLSKAALKKLNYKQEEVIGKNFFNLFIRKEIRKRLKIVFHSLIVKKKTFKVYENEILKKDGSGFFVSWRNIYFKAGKTDLILSIGIDKTDEKKVQEAQEEREENYKKITDEWEQTFDAINDVVAIFDKDLNVMRANKKAIELAGRNINSNKSIKCFSFFQNRDNFCPDCTISKVMADKKPSDCMISNMFGDKTYHLWFYPILDDRGNVQKIIEYGKDITNEIKISERNEFYAKVIRDTQEPIIIIDMNTNIIEFNHGAEDLLGYKKEEMIGKPAYKIIPKSRVEETKACYNQIFANKFHMFETERITKDKKVIPVSILAYLIEDSTGKPVAISTFIRDITDIKNQAKELKGHIEILEEKNKTLETLEKIVVSRELKMIELKKEIAKFNKDKA